MNSDKRFALITLTTILSIAVYCMFVPQKHSHKIVLSPSVVKPVIEDKKK